jgi:hypothetical protein
LAALTDLGLGRVLIPAVAGALEKGTLDKHTEFTTVDRDAWRA